MLPAILLLAVPRRLFCFGSLVILDVACRYLSYFVLDRFLRVFLPTFTSPLKCAFSFPVEEKEK